MDQQQIISSTTAKLSQAVAHFESNLKSLRTGRANSAMLDGIMVEAYGSHMPLNQTATISVPEPQLIQLTPFDPNNLSAIAEAIRNNQALGLNPTDDGRVIRLPIPPLNEERRHDLARQVGAKQEEAMVSIRNIRHEAMTSLDNLKKSKDIGEDEHKRLVTQIEDQMNKTKSQIEAATKAKEQEILTV